MDPIELIRQGKVKRYFRATRKLNAPNLVSHITQRAAGKEQLFLEDSDYLFMLGLIKKVSRQFALDMYAFCLMPNHVHLLFSQQEENLYDGMRDLFSRYAMSFNRKYERKGHLFGGPYRQAVCLEDGYLLAVSLYIHLNPIKAGLAKISQEYRWSSCNLYYNDSVPKSFIDPDFILGLLSESNLESRRIYRTLLEKGREIKMDYVSEQKDAIGRFQSKFAAILPSLFQDVDKRRRIAKTSGIELLDMEEVERKIESIIRDKYLFKPGSRKAKKFLIEQLISRGYKRIEIAEKLGVSRKTIYNILQSSE